ncbi:MAG TPA: right-handed parallel beta-helix repeat-containing protein [Candidatus Paceibacterota bacterium]|nr:right-handed parallel beta-helix repeat-containing protein [Candidatus Paceibacterota bacterium]
MRTSRSPLFVVATLGFCLFAWAAGAASAKSPARPELVRQVVNGHRHEAHASWWGFDAQDSTAYLQEAINSKVRKLIIDRQPSAWVTGPLRGVSHQEIILEAGTEVLALRGAYRGKGDCLLTFQECEQVVIRGGRKDGGKSAGIRMHKEDYQSGAYQKSEWRHGLAFLGCQDVRVQDLRIEKTGGDGIYLGTTPAKPANRNVVIRRVDCNANHRQGVSVISAENLLIEDCLLRNTAGTAPAAGIDFEPNSPGESLVNCVVRHCVSRNNAGTGFQICPQCLSSRSKPVSIYLEHCVSRSNQQHAVHLCSAPKDPPGGLLRITRLVTEGDGMAGLSVQFNPYDAMRVSLEDSIIRDSARDETFFPPLYVQGLDSDSRPAGNIHFKRLRIKDDLTRPVLRISDHNSNGLKDITGEIVLERNGRKERITVDDAWLQEMARTRWTNARRP